VQPGGNKGRPGSQRPGGGRAGATPGQRQGAGNRGPQQKTRPGGGGGGRGTPGGGRGTPVTAAPPRRFSPAAIGFGAVALVVIVVVALVVVKVTGGSSGNSSANSNPASFRSNATTQVVDQVTNVLQPEAATVGVPSGLNAPSVSKNQPPLVSNGKPEVLFIGAEFCPYCAAERWAVVMALSRFGNFSDLKFMTSSAFDTDPSTATFSFYKSTYTSNLVDFVAVEHETTDTTALGTRKVLEPLTSAEKSLWDKYSSQFGVTEGYPFLDIGNKVFVLGPTYNPAVLSGLDQAAIAAKLSNPSDPVTQAIVGTANYITAALCSVTNNASLPNAQGASWCTAGGTTAAAKALGIS